METPRPSVLDAFKIIGPPIQSEDGLHGVYFADDLILKHHSDEDEAQYICECYHLLAADDIVVPQPVLSSHRRYVEDGWIAYPRIPAKGLKGEFTFRHQLVRTFNKRTRALPWKKSLDARNDPWSVAHQIAFGAREIDLLYSSHARDLLSHLLGLCREPLPDFGVYHGDLANNVMLHENGRPVVLDFSPVLAPDRYAEAIFLVDIFAHQDAPESQLVGFLDDATFIEILIRATIFRIACSAEFEKRFQTNFFQKEAREWICALSKMQQIKGSMVLHDRIEFHKEPQPCSSNCQSVVP
jgi:hypothetical protein